MLMNGAFPCRKHKGSVKLWPIIQPMQNVQANTIDLVSTVFQLNRDGQCTYSCFPRVVLTSTLHNILSKPLAAFLHNHCRNNGQVREE